MKKFVHFALLMLSLVALTGCASQTTQVAKGTKALIIIRNYSSSDMPFMTDNELGVMIDMLEDASVEIGIASHTFDPYESETRTITPDFPVGDVDVTDYDAVILPCLAAGKKPASQEIIELIKEFDKHENVIAAQYGARVTLYEAKIIGDDQMDSSEVLQIGRVITSGCCPQMDKYYGCGDGTEELINKVIATLNAGE